MISYYSFIDNQLKPHISAACFADLRQVSPDSVLYFAKCGNGVSKECAEAYGSFVKSLFPDHIDYVVVEKNDILHSHLFYNSYHYLIVWNMRTIELGHEKLLLLGTFCRMVDEYHRLINLWHDFVVKNPTATSEAVFNRFQELHVEVTENKYTFRYGFSSHGLMTFVPRIDLKNRYTYSYEYPYNPLTIKEFNTLFKGKTTISVLSHFDKRLIPAVANI